jgi:hypothetical protein
MDKPQEYNVTTDYATPKNDGDGIISVIVSGSLTVASNAIQEFTSQINIGTLPSSMRAQGNSSRAPDDWIPANQISFTRTGTVGGLPASYDLSATLMRNSLTTVLLSVAIYNVYGSTLTTQSGSETITFDVSTLLPPFA